jgi:hypothetical protein
MIRLPVARRVGRGGLRRVGSLDGLSPFRSRLTLKTESFYPCLMKPKTNGGRPLGAGDGGNPILNPREPIVDEAIRRAGGATALARRLTELGSRITPQSVCGWQRIPPERVRHVARVTGIARVKLRPDIF